MQALSVRDYRNNLSASFDRANKGEPVIIRRRGELFALTSLGPEDVSISPTLQKRIDEAREAYRKGEVISCKTPKDLTDYLESL
ncbi:MAG: type II toxin-antitoxin system Phd/YefM family antitoxin [Muribaculaceae bacterium]|nr:type II toxin-antitoxin system Phd/YefM family antitoxin [Muribaculaceae bacterium]